MKRQSLAMFKKFIICLLIIDMLFISLSFTQPHSLRAEKPANTQEQVAITNQTKKSDCIQEQVPQVKK